MSRATTKKLEALDQKIASLKEAQLRIQDQWGAEVLHILKQTQAPSVDLPTLIGGLLDVISKIQTAKPEKEEWQKAGKKFLRNIPKAEKPSSASEKSSTKDKRTQ